MALFGPEFSHAFTQLEHTVDDERLSGTRPKHFKRPACTPTRVGVSYGWASQAAAHQHQALLMRP